MLATRQLATRADMLARLYNRCCVLRVTPQPNLRAAEYDFAKHWGVGVDRMPGLKYGEDGSLTLYVQHDPRTGGIIRRPFAYLHPQPLLLDGAYKLPPIKRVD